MKGKFYTFRTGDIVPSWMFAVDFKSMDRCAYMHNAHHGKIKFGRSCVVVRGGDGIHSKIMPQDNVYGDDCVIRVSGFIDCKMGGVCGATGVFLPAEGMPCNKHSAKLEMKK